MSDDINADIIRAQQSRATYVGRHSFEHSTAQCALSIADTSPRRRPRPSPVEAREREQSDRNAMIAEQIVRKQSRRT